MELFDLDTYRSRALENPSRTLIETGWQARAGGFLLPEHPAIVLGNAKKSLKDLLDDRHRYWRKIFDKRRRAAAARAR